MRDFKGKTAIVTGAASGIGLGMAKALAGAGMNIVLADLRPDPLEAARRQIAALGVGAIGVTVDVSDPGSVAAGRGGVLRWGVVPCAHTTCARPPTGVPSAGRCRAIARDAEKVTGTLKR